MGLSVLQTLPSYSSMVANDYLSDDEELCPLCIEELDLSDRNFKPCPCGYQICQFCYNDIRQNPELNGRCPACRRPYDDESVEYRPVTTEELRRDQQRQLRKDRERKQREREKKENENQALKKHLAGMRVIQKNLVYVIGLNPNIPTEELQVALRGDQFFGQYGKIQKIVINKRTNANGHLGLGVYVTFARKEDAARCIAAVDGSVNDGRYLRAAYGTTKYCSSYLRGQPCPNPSCMFLHEPGEEADSYTRRDLSAMQHRHGLPNGGSSSLSAGTTTSSGSAPSSAGTTHSANTATLPPQSVWGKTTHANVSAPATASNTTTNISNTTAAPTPSPLHPSNDITPLASDANTALQCLSQCLDSLKDSTQRFVFSSPLLSEEELKGSLPPLFSLQLPEDMRRKVYNKFLNELESVERKAETTAGSIDRQAQPSAQSVY